MMTGKNESVPLAFIEPDVANWFQCIMVSHSITSMVRKCYFEVWKIVNPRHGPGTTQSQSDTML